MYIPKQIKQIEEFLDLNMITALVSSCVGSPFLIQGDPILRWSHQGYPAQDLGTEPGSSGEQRTNLFFCGARTAVPVQFLYIKLYGHMCRCVSIVLGCIGSIHLGSQGLDLSILPFHWVEITIYWANILLKSP